MHDGNSENDKSDENSLTQIYQKEPNKHVSRKQQLISILGCQKH